MDRLCCSIILFTRIPVPGKTKTRLQAILSAEERALLQEAMALDLAEKLSGLGNPFVLSYSNEWCSVQNGEVLRDSFIDKIKQAYAHTESFMAIPQRGSDLGERMENAMQEAFAQGASACLLIGSDLPVITRSDVELALQALESSDIVLGPSGDGGYWLIGLKEPFPQIFEGKEFGTSSVLTDTVATCQAHERSVALLRKTFDVDVPNDYFLLCNQVNKGDIRLGKRTVDTIQNLMNVSAATSQQVKETMQAQ